MLSLVSALLINEEQSRRDPEGHHCFGKDSVGCVGYIVSVSLLGFEETPGWPRHHRVVAWVTSWTVIFSDRSLGEAPVEGRW